MEASKNYGKKINRQQKGGKRARPFYKIEQKKGMQNLYLQRIDPRDSGIWKTGALGEGYIPVIPLG